MSETTVVNEFGYELDYKSAMSYAYNADADICEELNMIGGMTPQEDFDSFCEKYKERHGEEFYLATENPCW